VPRDLAPPRANAESERARELAGRGIYRCVRRYAHRRGDQALGTMPREQVMQYVKYGMRSLFSQSAPMYRQKPSPSPGVPGGET
jgi:hypothetical protein